MGAGRGVLTGLVSCATAAKVAGALPVVCFP